MCICAKSLQACSALCDPVDGSLPGSSFHGILQARILERVAIPYSRGSSSPRDRTSLSLSAFPALASSFFTSNATWEACFGLKGKKKPGFEMKIEINA